MNKKVRNVLLLVLLAVLCLAVFTSCAQQRVGFFTYSEENLGVIGRLISWMHSWIKSYGWTVVVFTVFLKIIMLPLDFWQRYAARKSALKMQRMQPILEGIDKRYGANTQRANEEKQKLYKKSGFSMMSSCLPMIISMVIFFVMFGGLRDYSTFSSIRNYQNLVAEYYTTFSQEVCADSDMKAVYDQAYNAALGDDKDSEYAKSTARIAAITEVREKFKDKADQINAAQDKGLEAVQEYYKNNHESWLWMQNVWQPDTWATIMPEYKEFKNTIDMDAYGASAEQDYNTIREAVLKTGERGDNGKWNGLMILPFMSIGLSFLSMWVSQRLERKNRNGEIVQQNQQQAATNKTMMIIMPLMMAFFGFMYTGAFAIYMVANYAISILSTIALRMPVEKFVEKKLDKDDRKNNSSKASYMR